MRDPYFNAVRKAGDCSIPMLVEGSSGDPSSLYGESYLKLTTYFPNRGIGLAFRWLQRDALNSVRDGLEGVELDIRKSGD